MPFGRFLLYNLIGTVPKSLLFLLIGYTLGAAYASIDSWIARASILIGAVLLSRGALLVRPPAAGMKRDASVSCVVPAFNEAARIGEVLRGGRAAIRWSAR